ncbi:MAG: pyruvate kinase [Planctomycetota bacterium]
MTGGEQRTSDLIRTKIVATMGPAVTQTRDLRALLAAGVDVCRLNFSHGELDGHGTMLAAIRKEADKLDKRVAILGDLGGPKIRVGDVDEDNPAGGMAIDVGDELVIQRDDILGKHGTISVTYKGLVDDVEVGDRLYIEDGLLRFVCIRKEADRIALRCTAGGVIKTRKGVNLPSTKLKLPSITQRDWACVDWAIENDLDYLALSFVRRAGDIHQLRERLQSKQSHIGIIAKIEKAEAIEQIDAIIAAADGLMVARGDLGVEMDLARVPLMQKDLIERCRRAGKPAIVATQMLQSMVDAASPTRAEVSDVANAIFDGTDATMLSGETSVGKFPVGAVHVMQHVASATEDFLVGRGGGPEGASDAPGMVVSQATAKAVRRLLETMPCKLVVVYSHTGDTARIFAKQRFDVPVVALSADDRRLRQMALHYGVVPLHLESPGNLQELARDVDSLVQDRELADPGDRIVLVAGRSMGAPGTMNGIVIHTIGHDPIDPLAND